MLLNVPENPAPITVGIPEIFFPSAVTVSTNGIPAIIARISDNVIYFDLRTVEIEEIEIIVDAIASFIKSNKGC